MKTNGNNNFDKAVTYYYTYVIIKIQSGNDFVFHVKCNQGQLCQNKFSFINFAPMNNIL